MLIGFFDGERIEAASAQRGPEYRCPKCNGVLILKKGRRVIHHFAHKPPTNCTWAKGETQAHLRAKTELAQSFTDRGIRAEVEFVVETLTGDRRADVMAWKPNGIQVAFELQHTPISLDDIEARAFSYARTGIAQIWIPFLKPSVWENGSWKSPHEWFVEKYSPRPFERWVHGFHGGNGMWMYDPIDKKLWYARLAGHQIWVEETSWYSEGGEENSGGGYFRWSKRYKELTLIGPCSWDQLRVKTSVRKAYRTNDYSWPEGRTAAFVVD